MRGILLSAVLFSGVPAWPAPGVQQVSTLDELVGLRLEPGQRYRLLRLSPLIDYVEFDSPLARQEILAIPPDDGPAVHGLVLSMP